MKKPGPLKMVLTACLFAFLMVPMAYSGNYVIIGQGSPKPEEGNKLGNGYIYVDDQGKHASKVKIQTQGSSIYVAKIKVFYEGGASVEIPVGKSIFVEEEADPITLGTRKEAMEKIMIRFRSPRQATIVLWGR
ncbi:MAG: hypothetical protein JEZ02_08730 [Desulfatibacillum sp.]|nr:hypothetical protein [Desulfatibacillum sp.]